MSWMFRVGAVAALLLLPAVAQAQAGGQGGGGLAGAGGSGGSPYEIDADDDGYSLGEGDCDDERDDVNPGAYETCNGIDDDCDGDTDENTSCTGTYDSGATPWADVVSGGLLTAWLGAGAWRRRRRPSRG